MKWNIDLHENEKLFKNLMVLRGFLFPSLTKITTTMNKLNVITDFV